MAYNLFDTLLGADPEAQRKRFRFFNTIPGAPDEGTEVTETGRQAPSGPALRAALGSGQPNPMGQLMADALKPSPTQAAGSPALDQAIATLAARGPHGERHIGMSGEEITPSNPMGQSGFERQFWATRPQLTPEAQLASQGPSAMTQWAQRGGVQGVNPDVLRALMTPTNVPPQQPPPPEKRRGYYY